MACGRWRSPRRRVACPSCSALGLWQGYGAWLLSGGAGDVWLTPRCSPRCRAIRGRSSRCPRSSAVAGGAPRAKPARSRWRWRNSRCACDAISNEASACQPLDAALSRACAAAARSRVRLAAAGAGPAAGARRSCWRTPRSGWHCGSSGASPSNARCSRAPRPAGGAARWRRPFRRWRCWCCTRAALQFRSRRCCSSSALEAFGCWLLWRAGARGNLDAVSPRSPLVVLVAGAVGVFALSVFGLRGLLDIRDALRIAELDRLASPAHWQATRAWLGVAAGCPVLFAASALGAAAWLAGAATAALGYLGGAAVSRRGAADARNANCSTNWRVHLDLIALAMEAGRSLPRRWQSARDRAPEGALQRAWSARHPRDSRRRGTARGTARTGAACRVSSRWLSLVTALRSAEQLQHPCCAGVARTRASVCGAAVCAGRTARARRATQSLGGDGAGHRAVHVRRAGVSAGATAGANCGVDASSRHTLFGFGVSRAA